MVGPPPASWWIPAEEAGAREVMPGLWRLRLPLPWSHIPHVNAYALAADDGLVLVDCGSAGDPSCADALERALSETGHRLADVRLLIGTHTHSDHIGLAALVRERSGTELWMHGATAHFYDAMREPSAVAAARERRARAEGVPADLLGDFRDVREETEGVISPVEPDRELHEGMLLHSLLGAWKVLETPGHAPSHISLVQRERGIVIIGDLISPVFGPYFDYGYSDDPVAQYVRSLHRMVELEPLRLGLPGHGRPLDDPRRILMVHLAGIEERLRATELAVDSGAGGAWAVTARMFGGRPAGEVGVSQMAEVIAYLRHLRGKGRVDRHVAADGSFSYSLRPPPASEAAISQ